MIPLDGQTHLIELLLGDIAGNVPAIFNELEVVVRAGGALSNDMKRTFLHVLDLSDLLQNGLRSWC
jgi:hypothetical protein